VILSFCSPGHMTVNVHMSPDEARAISAELLAAVDAVNQAQQQVAA